MFGSSIYGSSGTRDALPRGDVIPKGYRAGQLQQFTPEGMNLYRQLYSHLGPESYTARLAKGSPEAFEEIEAPALQQFSGVLGGLSSRFSGMGMGARRSSGFQNTATAAASNFAQQLQAQRQSLQRQAVLDLMGMSNQLLGQRPYERFLTEKQQKESSGYGALIGAGLGGAAGLFAGGPGGALAGAQLGYGIGSSF